MVAAAVIFITIYLNQYNDALGSDDTNAGKDESLSTQTSSSQPSKKEAAPQVTHPAPSFHLETVDGAKSYSLEDAKGKPLILNFWASWCGPCQDEASGFQGLYQKYKDDVQIYGINLTQKDNVKAAKQFMKTYDLSFPVLMDKKGKVSEKYWIRPIPTTFFIDADGTIVYVHKGYLKEQKLERLIQQLIG